MDIQLQMSLHAVPFYFLITGQALAQSATGCGAIICPTEHEDSCTFSFDEEHPDVLPHLSRQLNAHLRKTVILSALHQMVSSWQKAVSNLML